MNRIEKLKAFLKDQPNDAFLQHALALEYIKIGDDVQAKQLFKSILMADPTYVGSYYHLGKLLERQGQNEAAINCYQKGMTVAKELKNNHAYNELQSAKEDLED
jgi:Tfp pilus assembly protein PilF